MSFDNVNVNVSGPVQPASTYKTKVLKGNHPFSSQVTEPNTKYVIKHDFVLDGDVTIPENCVLVFDGGGISGEHTITGTNTGINAGLVKIFNTDVTLAGTWNVSEAYPEWFGAKGDGETDDHDAIQSAVNFCKLTLKTLKFSAKRYSLKNKIVVWSNMILDGNGAILSLDHSFSDDESFFGVISNSRACKNIENLQIKNFTIYINKKTLNGIYIASYGGSKITIENVTVYDPLYDGILVHGGKGDDGSSGNTRPYLYPDDMNWRYKVINCKAINSDPTATTRTGIMFEQCYSCICENCFVTGFHTGIHIEGGADASFVSCTCEDNCGPKTPGIASYYADYLIARSENVSVVGCKARRINKGKKVEGDNYYNSLSMLNPFAKGFSIVASSFVGGRIFSNVNGAIDTNNSKIGITFDSCVFNDANIIIQNVVDINNLYGFKILNSIIIGCSMYLSRCEGLTISNNNIFFGENQKLELNNSKDIVLYNNYLKQGDISINQICENIAIDKCTIYDGNISIPTYQSYRNNIEISNTVVTNGRISVQKVNNLKLLNNSISYSNGSGISISYCDNSEINGNSIINGRVYLGNLEHYNVIGNKFAFADGSYVQVNDSVKGNIKNNFFINGNNDETVDNWQKSQMYFSGSNRVKICNNQFTINNAKYCIGFYGCNRFIISENVFEAKGYVISVHTGTVLSNSIIKNNIYQTTTETTYKGIINSPSDSEQTNVIDDNIEYIQS